MKRPAIDTILFSGRAAGTAGADLVLAVLRIVAGLGLALGHGLGKTPPSEGFIDGVAQMGFPLPVLFAWTAAMSELAGGLLLALGLLTRPAALAILCTMSVAAFLRHAGDPFSDRELALLYLAISLVFLITGAGRYGLDRFLRDEEGRGQ